MLKETYNPQLLSDVLLIFFALATRWGQLIDVATHIYTMTFGRIRK